MDIANGLYAQKIVFCVQFYDYIGGAESQLLKQMPYYKKTFSKAKIVTQGTPSNYNLFNKLRFFVYCLHIFILTLLTTRKTVFYFIGSGTEKKFFFLANQLRFFKLNYIVKFPGTFDSKFEEFYLQNIKGISGRIIHKYYEMATWLIVQDKISLELIKKNFSRIPERLAVIQNGVNVTPDLKPRPLHDPAKILFVGRMIRLKGIFFIIELAHLIGNSCEFHLIGDGEDLVSAKQKSKQTENIFFHGRLLHNEVKSFYLESDIFLFPSQFREGLPNVVLEAMSHCLPVISTPVGALPELFENMKEILFLDHENLRVEDISSILQLLLKNNFLRNDMAASGYEKVASQFSVEQAAQKNIDLIKSINCG